MLKKTRVASRKPTWGGVRNDLYLSGFLKEFYNRPSCHKCLFTTTNRCGDFTIADWWGYKNAKGENQDYEKKGVSLLFCNTKHSLRLLPNIEAGMQLRERTLAEAHKTNFILRKPYHPSPQREAFWHDYKTNGYKYVASKYLRPQRATPTEWFMRRMRPSRTRKTLIFISNKFYGLLRKIKARL